MSPSPRSPFYTATSLPTRIDASPLAPGKRMRAGIAGGSAACREVAAYLLDHHSFAGVPPTMLAVMQHEAFFSSEHVAGKKLKIGSLQAFVAHSYDADDLPSSTVRRFPLAEVHRLAVLDIRLCNTDRHGGNVLVRDPAHDRLRSSPGASHSSPSLSSDDDDDDGAREPLDGDDDEELFGARRAAPTPRPFALSFSADDDAELQLVPIDHGYVLPEDLSEAWFAWQTWPQASEPFDDTTRAYIAALDWRADCALLRRFGMTFTPACQKVLRTTTTLLQKAAAAGLSPRAIATLMCREQLDEPSRLELLCARALADTTVPQQQQKQQQQPPQQQQQAKQPSPLSSSASTSQLRTRSRTLSSLPPDLPRFAARRPRSATQRASIDDEAYFARLEALLDDAVASLLAAADDDAAPLSSSSGLFDFELGD
jgi:hypothetical protein